MPGATILGEQAGDLFAEHSPAMRLTLGHILSTIQIYPTMPEADRHAAGEWRRPCLLALLDHVHCRRRG